ncbi:MAG: 4Fe-4S dicluster domain-containing protein [bacterium]|nr:4Fe-4S dicluster domain-containing protein [bacterium]
MKPVKCKCVFFSPTGTTKTIVNEIAAGIGIQEKEVIDFTMLPVRNQNQLQFKNNELAIIGVPVYSGRIPLLIEDFIQRLKADETPAVVVVLYGNREYDDALLELKDLCNTGGFKIIAGGAFIGEHSMSTAENPIAPNRPDENDLTKAREFGSKIKEKLNNVKNSKDIINLTVPGNSNYIKRSWMPKIAPKTDKKACTVCKKCASVCPTEAIILSGAKIKTDKNKCILCNACIKTCPGNAREIKNILFKKGIKKIYLACQNRKEPEMYLTKKI